MEHANFQYFIYLNISYLFSSESVDALLIFLSFDNLVSSDILQVDQTNLIAKNVSLLGMILHLDRKTQQIKSRIVISSSFQLHHQCVADD